ncbi:MAG: hypothetical protein WCG27_10930, partial [Pseudomonadota bacterium]
MSQRVKPRDFYLIGVFIVLLAIGGLFLGHWGWNDQKQSVIGSAQELEILFKASEELSRLWQEGDVQGLWKSGKLDCPAELGPSENVEDDFLRCNPNFLQCYFSYLQDKGMPPFSLKHKGKVYNISIQKDFSPMSHFGPGKRFYKILTRSTSEAVDLPPYAVWLKLKIEKGTTVLDVLLEDSCRDAYLPPRIYAYGPPPPNWEDDWRFDTFGQGIYIDKFLASNRDIAEWLDIDPLADKSLNSIITTKMLMAPAIGLNPQQMADYCQFKGKELLAAHLLDAASFHPGDYQDNKPLYNLRGNYPQTRKESQAFLYQAKNQANFIFKDEYCSQVYTQECRGRPYSAYGHNAVSWIGIFQTLGGIMEMVRNPIDPTRNVRASSFYFPAYSSWHALGRRAHCEGPHFLKENLDWKWEDNSENPPNDLGTLSVG